MNKFTVAGAVLAAMTSCALITPALAVGPTPVEVELWNKSAAAQLDAQLRERRRNFTRRIEAVSRIQQAASGLDERIRELQTQQAALNQLEAKFGELTEQLMAASEDEPADEALVA